MEHRDGTTEELKCWSEMQVLTSHGMVHLYCDREVDHEGAHHCEIEWG